MRESKYFKINFKICLKVVYSETFVKLSLYYIIKIMIYQFIVLSAQYERQIDTSMFDTIRTG